MRKKWKKKGSTQRESAKEGQVDDRKTAHVILDHQKHRHDVRSRQVKSSETTATSHNMKIALKTNKK